MSMDIIGGQFTEYHRFRKQDQNSTNVYIKNFPTYD